MEDVTDSQALFRQMKASIRGSEKYLLVGIDVAKNKHHAFFGTPNGRTLRKNMVFYSYVSNVAVAKNRALLDGRWDKNDMKDAANVADLVGKSRCLL